MQTEVFNTVDTESTGLNKCSSREMKLLDQKTIKDTKDMSSVIFMKSRRFVVIKWVFLGGKTASHFLAESLFMLDLAVLGDHNAAVATHQYIVF